MPAQHAPAGGVTIKGVEYHGGQFIPSEVVDSLTPEEKTKAGLASGGGGFAFKKGESSFTSTTGRHPEAVYRHAFGRINGGERHPLFDRSQVVEKFDDLFEQEGIDPDFDEPDVDPEDEDDGDDPPEVAKAKDARHAAKVAKAKADHDKELADAFKQAQKNTADHFNEIAGHYKEKFDELKDRPGFDPKEFADKVEEHFDPDDAEATIQSGAEEYAESLDPEEEEEEEELEPAAKFGATYFDADSPGHRVDSFIDAMEGADFDAADLDDDTKQAVAEDLANWSSDPSDLLSYAANARSRNDPAEMAIIEKALELAPAGPRRPFDPKKEYRIFDLNDEDTDDGRLLPLMARHAGAVWQSENGDRFVVQWDHTGGQEMPESESKEFDSEEGLQKIFEDLPNPTVSEHDVPASAKNTGRVSGGENAEMEADWHPDNVDVYKPINANYFLLRRGEHSPEVKEGGKKYEIVPRAKTGQRAGLPPQYWEGLSATEPESYDEEGAEKKEKTADRQSDKKAGKARTEKEKLKRFKREFGSLTDRHNRLEQSNQSATAHETKANEAKDAVEEGFKFEEGTPMEDAYTELVNSLDGVFMLNPPDAPEMTLADVRESINDAHGEGENQSRAEAAKAYSKTGQSLEKNAATFRTDLIEAEKEHKEHFDKLKAGWQKAYEAATAALNMARDYKSEESDDEDDESEQLSEEDARQNARLALAAARTAKRQLRKIDRSKGNK